MLRLIPRSTARSFMAALLVASLFSLAAPKARAAVGLSDPVTGPREASAPAGAEAPKAEAASTSEARPPNVLYVAFDGVGSLPVKPAPEPASRPRRVAERVEPVVPTSVPMPPQPPSQNASGVISTAPMTVGEKFHSWIRSRFLSPGTYGSAVFNGMWKELNDNDDFKKDTVENYFADSMTRAARSYASGTTNAFYERALFASLFRQDPRYHRSGRKGAGAKIAYAVTRVFVTQGDRCECHQFNASFLLGAAAGAVTANLWERRERTGPMHTIARFYNHVGITAFYNIIKEFVGGQ